MTRRDAQTDASRSKAGRGPDPTSRKGDGHGLPLDPYASSPSSAPTDTHGPRGGAANEPRGRKDGAPAVVDNLAPFGGQDDKGSVGAPDPLMKNVDWGKGDSLWASLEEDDAPEALPRGFQTRTMGEDSRFPWDAGVTGGSN